MRGRKFAANEVGFWDNTIEGGKICIKGLDKKANR